MADPLSMDEGEDRTSAKENFVGRIVASEVESDDYGMDEEYMEADSSYFEHVYEIDVLDHDWGNLHVFSLEVNNNFQSKWMVLVGHLQQIHGDLADEHGVESLGELADFLTDRVYEFREITWQEDEEFDYPGVDKTVNFGSMFAGSENLPNPLIVPVREVTDEEELDSLGEDTPTEIDEDVEL